MQKQSPDDDDSSVTLLHSAGSWLQVTVGCSVTAALDAHWEFCHQLQKSLACFGSSSFCLLRYCAQVHKIFMIMFSNLQLLREGFVFLVYSRFFTLKERITGTAVQYCNRREDWSSKSCGLEICSTWIKITAGTMLNKGIHGGDAHDISVSSSRSLQSSLHLISFSPQC